MNYNTASPMGNAPQLGTPIPGTTGGLPAQGGLNVAQNPMAQQLQSQGRGEDSMLIHMTPGEVNSLQGLAMAHGGSLTINPETGLPEAGFLKKLLPTILGAGLMLIPGVNALAAAGMVAAGSVAKTGSLKKGLMAGLSAYGGASLAGGLGAGNVFGAAAKSAAPAVGAGSAAADMASQIAGTTALPSAATTAGSSAANMASQIAGTTALPSAATTVGTAGTAAAKTGLAGLAQNFGNAARAGLPAGTPGIISKAAPMMAASGLMQGVSGAMTPSMGTMGSDGMVDNSYAGPYTAQQRKASFAGNTEDLLKSSKERRYFDVDMPEVYNMQGQTVQPGSSTARGTPIMQNYLLPTTKKTPKGSPMYGQRFVPYMGEQGMGTQDMGYADGGEVDMKNGSFVVDARTVSELGNGSSNAGMELLSRMGGRPLQGPGDGVSDSIRARIGGKQEARVARDEVLFPPEAVKRLGAGNPKKGTAKLYSLMNKAHTARKKADRGEDTKLRRGLA